MPEEKEKPVVSEKEIERIIKELIKREKERTKVFETQKRYLLEKPKQEQPKQPALKTPSSAKPLHSESPSLVLPPKTPFRPAPNSQKATPSLQKPKRPPSPIQLFLRYFFSFACFFILFYFSANHRSYQEIIKYDYQTKIKKQKFSTQTIPALKQESVNLPDSIIIPKINLNAPIIWEVEEKDILKKLNEGVVHFRGTALPNEPGNTVLTAHSSYYPWQKTKYGEVFALLGKLEPKDNIEIIYNKKRYTYEVTKKEIISPEEVWVLTSKEPRLTLITCWPVGTSLQRLVVYANQVGKPQYRPSQNLFLPTVF